jgi:pimeloyl-ACP methyl ester carboxylesterase
VSRCLPRSCQWSESAGTPHLGTLATRTLGQGRTILLLHGLVGSGRYWGGDFDALANSGRLVVPDLLGFGRSPWPGTGLRARRPVRAIVSCLDELGATDAAVVGAHSAGALIALCLAATTPNGWRPLWPLAHPPALIPRQPGPVVGFGGRWPALWCYRPSTRRSLCLGVQPSPRRRTTGRADPSEYPAAASPPSASNTPGSPTRTHCSRLSSPPEPTDGWRTSGAPVWLVAGDTDRVMDHAYLRRLLDVPMSLGDLLGDHHLRLRTPAGCLDALSAAL